MKKVLLGAVVVVSFTLSAANAAPGQSAQVEVAPPAAQMVGYASETILAAKGAPLVFVNADPLAAHDIVSNMIDSSKRPLFKTPVEPVGGAGTADLSKLQIGVPYAFHCSIHPGMTGTLTVQA